MFVKARLEDIQRGNSVLDNSQTNDMQRIIKAFEAEGVDTTKYELDDVFEIDGRMMYVIVNVLNLNWEVVMASTDSGKLVPHYYRNNGFERYELAEANSIVEAIERYEKCVLLLPLRDIRDGKTCLSPEQQEDMERVLEVLARDNIDLDLDLWALAAVEEEDGLRKYGLMHENGEDDLLATVNRDGDCTVRT